MPWFNGHPYTSFKGVNVKDGRIRFQDETNPYGVRIELDNATVNSEKKIYIPDATTGGTLVVRGYHVTYGTSTCQRNSNIAASTVYTGTAAVTGILTTSVIFIQMDGMKGTGAAAGPIPLGAGCTTAGIADLVLVNTAATTAAGTTVIEYILLHPQTT